MINIELLLAVDRPLPIGLDKLIVKEKIYS